jgi:hypothetical protein
MPGESGSSLAEAFGTAAAAAAARAALENWRRSGTVMTVVSFLVSRKHTSFIRRVIALESASAHPRGGRRKIDNWES